MKTNWWHELYANWLPGDLAWDRDDPAVREWAEVRWRVANYLRPATIAEIGVRAGYSAYIFLCVCPQARYLGIDDWAFRGWGGELAAEQHAKELLSEFPAVSFLKQDSHELNQLPDGPYDLVHVDGDHSSRGLKADLDLALRSGAKHILVDDVNGIAEVKSATHWWLRKHPAVDVIMYTTDRQGAALLRTNR